jgi:Fe-S-cluster formation regulator IscX/YfhJ
MRNTAATRKLERDLETARAMYDGLNDKLDAEYVRGNALSRDLTTLEAMRRDLTRAKRRLLEAAESFDALKQTASAEAIRADVAELAG